MTAPETRMALAARARFALALASAEVCCAVGQTAAAAAIVVVERSPRRGLGSGTIGQIPLDGGSQSIGKRGVRFPAKCCVRA